MGKNKDVASHLRVAVSDPANGRVATVKGGESKEIGQKQIIQPIKRPVGEKQTSLIHPSTQSQDAWVIPRSSNRWNHAETHVSALNHKISKSREHKAKETETKVIPVTGSIHWARPRAQQLFPDHPAKR